MTGKDFAGQPSAGKRFRRLEASDSYQARGMDTQAMIPVLAMGAELISMLCFGWVSVPELKFSPYPMTEKFWRLEKMAEGIEWNYQTPLSMTEAAGVTAGFLRAGMAAGFLLGVSFIIYAYRKKIKAANLGRLAFLWNAFMCLAAFAWVLDTNMALNLWEGRNITFKTLTVYSHVQLTAAAYVQIVIALFLLPSIGTLLDTRKEYAAEYYQARDQAADRGIGKRTMLSVVLILTAIPAVILFGIFFLNDRSDYFISVCVVILSMIPFFMVFEDRRPQAREVVVIAVMAGLGVAGRMAFFMLPQFKPMAAIVIITGVSLGAEAGFLSGALAGFVSNFFFGQGPWTPWQMFALGIIGFLSGLLFRRKRGKWKYFRLWLCIYGGVSVLVIYGLIMDTQGILLSLGSANKALILSVYVSGFPMNLIHGTATVIFLAVLGEPMMKKLDRIKKKYGILEP